MEPTAPDLPARNLRSLLDETFAIYGRHFWIFAGLAAFVQVPITLLSAVMLEVLGGGSMSLLATEPFRAFGVIFVYGAGVFAVGQQYVTGEIAIRTCYARAWWRVLSLALLIVIIGAVLLVSPVTLMVTEQNLAVMVGLLLVLPAISLAIYWSMAVQVVIVEGHKALGALQRSFSLIRGSWWRILGITLVFGLVALGLAIIVTVPFAVVSRIVGGDLTSPVSSAIMLLGGVVAGIVVPPVLFIAGTLLYYDLRVRKEEYSMAVLSKELGIATA